MNYLLLIAIIFAFILLFIFYGLRKEEEYNEKKVTGLKRVGSELYDYYLDIIEYVTTGYYKDAKKLLKEVVDKNPDEYPAYILLSYILRQEGTPEKALSIDKTIYANESLTKRGKTAILKSLLMDYMGNGMYKTALNTLEENEKDLRKDEFFLNLAKEVSYKLGDYEKALEYNKNLLDKNKVKDKSELGYIAAEMALEAINKQNFDTAENLIKKGKKYNDSCERIFIVESILQEKKGNSKKAQKLIMKSIDLNPKIIDFIENQIYNLYQNNYDKIIKDLNKIVDKNLYNPYIHVFLSNLYRYNEEYENAIEELHEAILYKPESHFILLMMLDIYIDMGNWEKVAEIKDELKKLEEEKQYVCENCGRIYHQKTWYCDNCREWGSVAVKL